MSTASFTAPECDQRVVEQRLQDHYRSRYHPDIWKRGETALDVARAAHLGQTRVEGAPYVVHPVRAALILALEVKVRDPELLSAALLHDVLEDTYMTADVLELLVGKRVTGIVRVLTTPEDAEGKRRYLEALKEAPPEVRLVKLADRLDNVRGLHLVDELARQRKYLRETREHFLPLAEATHAYLAAELAVWCERFAVYLDDRTASAAATQT